MFPYHQALTVKGRDLTAYLFATVTPCCGKCHTGHALQHAQYQ